MTKDQIKFELLKDTLIQNNKVLVILRDSSIHNPTRKMLADLMDANTRAIGIAEAA